MAQRDLKAIAQASVFTIMVVATISFELPKEQTAAPILIGRTIFMIVFGAFAFSIEVSFSEARPVRLLPQTQLILWAVGLLAIFLATNGLQWFAPTAGYWIGMAVMLTLIAHKGFRWLWQQTLSKVRRKNSA